MIYPKENGLIHWFFDNYVKRVVKRQFHELLFNKIALDPNKSVLLIANHFSFWDGLILYCINDRLLKKKFHVMILEDTVKKEYFLKYAGGFSVSKNSRDILASLDYAAKLLDDPQNMVLIYPQGKLYSNFVEHINFEKGVQRIITQAQGKFQLLFAATFAEHFNHKKQTAHIYLKNEPENFAGKNIAELQEAYQQHYNASKLQQTLTVI